MNPQDYLTPAECAERLRISVRLVRRAIRDGRLAALCAGPRTWRIAVPDLDRWRGTWGKPAVIAARPAPAPTSTPAAAPEAVLSDSPAPRIAFMDEAEAVPTETPKDRIPAP